MPMSRRCQHTLLLLAAALSLVPSAAAQTVFFTGPDNQINQGTFVADGPGFAFPVVELNGSNFKGLAAREDGLLLVANSTQSGAVLACDPASGECAQIVPFPQAGALALAADTTTLFAVNAAPGGTDQLIALIALGGCPSGIDPGEGLGCLPGGYDASGPLLIDDDIDQVDGTPIHLLADVRSVPFSEFPFARGDVAVLSQDPPMLFVYRDWQDCTGSCKPEAVVLPPSAFDGREPRGFVFDIDNSVLVTTKDGDVLRFSPPGYDPGSAPEVVATLPGTGAKIAVGIVDGQAKAFVAVRNGGLIQSYAFRPDGDGNGLRDGLHDGLRLEDEISIGVNTPDGVATPSSVAFAALQGGTSFVTVNTSGLETTWEAIVSDGISLVLCQNFADPREATATPGNRLFLCHPEPVNEGDPEKTCPDLADLEPERAELPPKGDNDRVLNLGLPVVIPSYMRAYRTLDLSHIPPDAPGTPGFPDFELDNEVHVGPSGLHTLRICIATTTASFTGLVTDIAQEEAYLGYDPAHRFDLISGAEALDCRFGSRFLYATDPFNDQEIPEGRFAIDTSFSCGFNSQGFFQRSILIPNAFDTRDLEGQQRDVASAGGCSFEDGTLPCKLANLNTVFLSDSVCMTRQTRKRAQRALDKAIGAFERGHDDRAQTALCGFQAIVDEDDSFICDPANRFQDHLRARVHSANHTLGLLRDPTVNFCCPGDPAEFCQTQ